MFTASLLIITNDRRKVNDGILMKLCFFHKGSITGSKVEKTGVGEWKYVRYADLSVEDFNLNHRHS